jgi:hypothetical protein
MSIDGEAAAPIYFIDDRGGIMSTAVLILDPDRLSNPDGRQDGKGSTASTFAAASSSTLRRGARLLGPQQPSERCRRQTWTAINGPASRARARPGGRSSSTRSTSAGRTSTARSAPQLGHGPDEDAGPLRLGRAAGRVTNAVFGMYVTSPARQRLRQRGDGAGGRRHEGFNLAATRTCAGLHEQTDVSMNGVRLAVLFPNEKIETVSAKRATTNFVRRSRMHLGAVASALGISREQLSQDWTGINYSSARTLLNEIWRGLLADRHSFTQGFCTPIYRHGWRKPSPAT